MATHGIGSINTISRVLEAAMRDPLVKEQAWTSKIYHRRHGLWVERKQYDNK
jgi:hypothetical protein